MESHNHAVSLISSSVKKFHSQKQQFRIYHGSTNSTRKSQLNRYNIIDTSSLTRVLEIDPITKTILVEPNVPMDALVSATLSQNLLPPVVMEFPGITVGGGFAGTAGESSSYRYGFFDRTVFWIEVVLATGEIVHASPTENQDLFYGSASSFGTLGITTLLRIQLIDAKKYVALTYIPISGIEEAKEEIWKTENDREVDYIDGILFSSTEGVICVGTLTDTLPPNTKPRTFSNPSDPWFYIHAQKLLDSNPNPKSPITEIIPITDYLFRYDRGGFWVAKYAYKYFLTPFTRITRFILDPLMKTRVMYHALHKSGLSDLYIIQDVAIPYEGTEEFMSYIDTRFGNYPIWLCPLNQNPDSPLTSNSNSNSTSNSTFDEKRKKPILTTRKPTPEKMLNFGVWGPGPSFTSSQSFKEWNRAFENKVSSLGGQKWLYAHTYYSDSEFWDIYDKGFYEGLRMKWGAEWLPSVWEKVRVKDGEDGEEVLRGDEGWRAWVKGWVWGIWPVRGVWGVVCAVGGGEYLLGKERKVKERHKDD